MSKVFLRNSIAAISFCVAGTCLAQSTVAELTAQGAKKFSKEELQQLHAAGVTQKGTLRSGATYRQQNKPDGSVSGNGQSPRGSFGLFGTWKIDDAGKLCLDLKTTAGGGLESCFFVWSLGTKYFSTLAEAPDTEARPIEFEK